MENIQLRQFKPGDENEINHLHVQGLKQTNSLIEDPESRKQLDQDMEHIREVYIDNRGDFIVASFNDQIVGMGAIRKFDEVTAEVKRMRVRLDQQGEGIGKMILDRLIERAKELGYKRLVLDTTKIQVAARRLYESRGFKEFKKGKIFDQEVIWYQLDI